MVHLIDDPLHPANVDRTRALRDADLDDDDHFRDECGVVGIYGHPEAANLTYLGLHALQHRGQESAGIVTSEGEQLFVHRAMGLVQDVFSHAQLEKLPGRNAIGHVRYSTAGGSGLKNAQPFAVDFALGSLAICHNGNLTNADELRAELEASGSIFQSSSDSEVLVHLVARSSQPTVEDRISDALGRVKGAYSLLFMTEEKLVAVRDPRGVRPLCLGILPGSKQSGLRDAYIIASEPTAFDLVGAEFVRDFEPGEMLIIDGNGMRSLRLAERAAPHMCIFEYVYFARPDSHIQGRSVYEVRKLWARPSRASIPPRPTSSFPCPTRVSPRPSATPPPWASPSKWG